MKFCPFHFCDKLNVVAISFVSVFFFLQVHSECPERQMRTERRAMILLRRILEAYQEAGGGDDWKFCLLAASILSDVAMNNVTRGTFVTYLITLGIFEALSVMLNCFHFATDCYSIIAIINTAIS